MEIEIPSESYLDNLERLCFVICLHTKDLLLPHSKFAQLAGAVEYTDCISGER